MRPPVVALLLRAGLSSGARVCAPPDLNDELKRGGYVPAHTPPLDAFVLDREAWADGAAVPRAWRQVRPGGVILVQGPGVVGRLRGRAPERPAALEPIGLSRGWAAWRVPALEALRPREGVVAREIDRELFLVDLRSGATFRLNTAGKAVWEGLVTGCTLEACADALPAAPPERALADVRALVQDLAEAGLLVPV